MLHNLDCGGSWRIEHRQDLLAAAFLYARWISPMRPIGTVGQVVQPAARNRPSGLTRASGGRRLDNRLQV